MNHRSLVFRLGAWCTLLLSAAFGLVGTATFYGLQHYLQSSLRNSLRQHAVQVEQLLIRAPTPVSNTVIAHEVETRLAPELSNRYIRIVRLPYEIVFASGPPLDRSFDTATVGAIKSLNNPRGSADSWIDSASRFMLISVTVKTESGRYTIDMGISTAPMVAVLGRFLDMLFLLLPVLIACAAVGAFLLVRWALRPVDQISQMAEQMSLKNLELRLPVIPSDDALERMSISMNLLLGRLRDSVQTSRRVLADASHEFRKPLTVIKGELQEIAGGAEIVDASLRERIGSVLEEVDRLEQLVLGLRELSRLDRGTMQRERVDVDLAELLRGTAEQMRLMAEDRGLNIELSGLRKTVIRGDYGRLKQIVGNLLSNAIQFGPPGGSVTLCTVENSERVGFSISDTGIGIPESALGRVLDRFFRVDEARSRQAGGAGLGLSIVKSICSILGATIEVDSRLGAGNTFYVSFPRRMGDAMDAVSSLRLPVLNKSTANPQRATPRYPGAPSPSVAHVMHSSDNSPNGDF